jgi:hypothetical protein
MKMLLPSAIPRHPTSTAFPVDLSSNPVTLIPPSFIGSNFYKVIKMSQVLQTALFSEDGGSGARPNGVIIGSLLIRNRA